MPPSTTWTRYDNQRSVGLTVHDSDADLDDFHVRVGQEDTRFGPDIADSKFLTSAAFSPATFSPTSKGGPPRTHDFRVRHNASDSIATTASSLTGADSDADAIELSSLRSLARTARAQSHSITNLGFRSSHARIHSTTSTTSTNTAASLPSTRTSTSEDVHVYTYEDRIADRSAVRSTLSCDLEEGKEREADNDNDNINPRSDRNSRDACGGEWHRHSGGRAQIQPTASPLCEDDQPLEENVYPLRPMSPRQTRPAHRIYVPSSTHHDNTQKFHNDLFEAELGFPSSSSSPVGPSPDSEHTIALAVETDSLLPLQKTLSASQEELPLPVTSPSSECDEPTLFMFSFSRVETAFHAVGFLVTTILVVLSVWLTLANVVM